MTGGDEQVFRARVERGLEDIDFAAHAPAGGVGERGFAHAGLAEKARIHGQVLLIHHHPGGQQLPHQLLLPDPLYGEFVRVGEVKRDAFDFHGHASIMRWAGRARRYLLFFWVRAALVASSSQRLLSG